MINQSIQSAVRGLLGKRAVEVDLDLIFESLDATTPDYRNVMGRLARNHGSFEEIGNTVDTILVSARDHHQEWFDAFIAPFTDNSWSDAECSDSFIPGVLIGIFRGLDGLGPDYVLRNLRTESKLAALITHQKGLLKYRGRLDSVAIGGLKNAADQFARGNTYAVQAIIPQVAFVAKEKDRPTLSGVGEAILEAFVYAEFKRLSNWNRAILVDRSSK